MNKRAKKAVSEVVGTVLLLGLSISLFSLLSFVIISYPFSPPTPSVNIVGFVDENGNIILEHRGGQKLSLDTKILIKIGNQEYSPSVRGNLYDANGDGYWNLGESFVYNPGYISNKDKIGFTVIDIPSNSIIITGVIHYKGTATLIITSSAGANGRIIPNGVIYVNYGQNKVFTITPNIGYIIQNVIVDGVNKGAIASYTFYNIVANHTISASFVFHIVPLDTHVDPISSPVISTPHTITATGDSGLNNVTLWYRWSDNNSTWDGGLIEVKDPVDSNTSNMDGSADKGTETNFANAKEITPDGDYMTIQEANIGGTPAGYEWLNCNALGNTYSSWTRVGTTPYVNAQDQPTNYVYESTNNAQIGWFDFPSTTLTGTLTVNISIYCNNNDGTGNDGADVYVDYTGTGSGTNVGRVGQHTNWQYDIINLGTHTVSEVNNLRVYLRYIQSGSAHTVRVDHMRIGVSSTAVPNYQIDFEYQWTAAVYNMVNKQLCIYVTSHTGTENLLVNYWTGSAWSSLGTITGTGWSNFTAIGLTSSTYTIQLKGTSESGDTSQDSWNIDVIMLHTWNTTGGPHGQNWMIWSNANNPDILAPWSWSFNFPNGKGYYEFYSIGKYGGNTEAAPLTADARCYFALLITVNLNPNTAYDNTGSTDYTLTADDLTRLASSDNIRYRTYDTWDSSYSDNDRIEFNFPDIPTDSTVSVVTLNFEWCRELTVITAARLRIYDGTTWQTYTLNPGSPNIDVSVILDLYDSPYNINTAAKVNNLKVWFQAQSNNNGYTTHDWVQVAITYTQ